MTMSEQTTADVQTEVEKEGQTAAADQNNKNVLFGTISYTDDSAYENFIKTMSVNQAVFVLIASANFAQAKGAFNLLESEVLSSAIRVIKKTSTTDPAPDQVEPSTNS
jgi:hypothetical protein